MKINVDSIKKNSLNTPTDRDVLSTKIIRGLIPSLKTVAVSYEHKHTKS